MKIKLLFENAKVPTYATDGSAAFDFYATNAVTISPGNSGLTGTGIAVEIPKTMSYWCSHDPGMVLIMDYVYLIVGLLMRIFAEKLWYGYIMIQIPITQ